jgi:hypothetical protein
MEYFGVILYLVVVALALMFWLKRGGLSLDGLLERSEHDHHHVHRVIVKQPLGGSWKEHKQWMREESE